MPQNHARDDAPLVSRNFRLFFFPVNPHRLQCRGRKRETTMASTMSLRQAGRSLAGLARTNLNKTKQGVRNMSGGSYEEELGECCYVTQSRDEQDRREKNDKRKRERERGPAIARGRPRRRASAFTATDPPSRAPPSPPLPRFGSQHEHVEERDFRGPSLHCGPYGVHLLSGSPPRERAACVLLPAD